jgi:hypothetical protein
MIFKIFSPKNLAKIFALLTQNKTSFCKNCDHNIGFWEKRQFFRRKLVKIAENCDHNIGPRSGDCFLLWAFFKFSELPSPILDYFFNGKMGWAISWQSYSSGHPGEVNVHSTYTFRFRSLKIFFPSLNNVINNADIHFEISKTFS